MVSKFDVPRCSEETNQQSRVDRKVTLLGTSNTTEFAYFTLLSMETNTKDNLNLTLFHVIHEHTNYVIHVCNVFHFEYKMKPH